MQNNVLGRLDLKEIELPETILSRDIETEVFQSICRQAIEKIEGISPLEANILDNLLGRSSGELTKGIYVTQDQKMHSVHIKLEVNVAYGVSMPKKAEELQTEVLREIAQHTGLHVASVHVVFKHLVVKKESSCLELAGAV